MKLIAITLLAALAVTACAPSNSTTTGGSPSGSPDSTAGRGTGSIGGGGNGIDDKMLESFSIRIETLPEYVRYIAPVIRKISRGRGDIMTAYMSYAVHNKPWYLIPRPLENLSKEQIGTAFPTDQFALHSDDRVYIAKAFYDKMNPKERASLLMHEIVMGARLLMKKTPKEQCEKLAGANLNACNDAEMMKLAEAQDISESQRGTMDDHDHDAVKAMTIFLLQRNEDVTADAVTLKRRELGFVFPWDKAVSSLTIADVGSALKYAQLADVSLVPQPATYKINGSADDVACLFNIFNQTDEWFSMRVLIAYTKSYPDSQSALTAAMTLKPSAPMYPSPIRYGASENYLTFKSIDAATNIDGFDARGVLDPTNPKRVVDLVRLRPWITSEQAAHEGVAAEYNSAYSQVEIWLTREENPQIIQIVSRKLRVKLNPNADLDNLQPEDWQWVPNQNIENRCVPKTAAP